MIAQYFHYKILETKPLSELEGFKEHRRLRVFYHKGCKCVKCGIEATQLALGEGKRGSLHWDVYTDDFYPMTVDHVIPKSKGGTDELDNLEPMCCLCNWKKGNGDKPAYNIRPKYPNNSKFLSAVDIDCKIGDLMFTKNGRQKYKELGKISKFEINPHTNKLSVMIEHNEHSWYNLSSVYKNICTIET